MNPVQGLKVIEDESTWLHLEPQTPLIGSRVLNKPHSYEKITLYRVLVTVCYP
jgi:hypothetical protein